MIKNLYLNYGPKSDIFKRLDLIKKNGFDGVFLWYDEEHIDEWVKLTRNLELDIETFHLPYENCNHLWLDDELGSNYVSSLIKGVRSAGKYQVKNVIMHTMSGHNAPIPNSLGLERIERILEVCKEVNVNLAIENVRDINYSNYIFNNLNHKHLKMCLDFGHTHAFRYNIDDFDFKKYGHLITCVHISDNHGDGDEHLIPFHGNIEYKKIIEKLVSIGFTGPITSEAHWHNLMPEDEFISLVYKSLLKLEEIFGGLNG